MDPKADLVLEGGGVKGIGLVGAVSELERQGYRFVNLAGTSAGAIVASLLAAGYSTKDLEELVLELDFAQLADERPLTRIFGRIPTALTKLGFYKGDRVYELVRDRLEAKGIRTFGDLVMSDWARVPRYRYKLCVVASDVTRGQMLVLPHDVAYFGIHPDSLEVALAVRMSMSIPFVFEPVRLTDANGTEHLVVDGGLLSNFPVGLFDAAGEPPEWPTFGVDLVGPSLPPAIATGGVRNALSFARSVLRTALEARDKRYIDTHDFVRTITVDTLGIRETQFNLSHEQKLALLASGVRGARTFLAHWDFDRYRRVYRKRTPPTRRHLALPNG